MNGLGVSTIRKSNPTCLWHHEGYSQQICILDGASSATSFDAAGKVDGSYSSPKAYMFICYYFMLNFICGGE